MNKGCLILCKWATFILILSIKMVIYNSIRNSINYDLKKYSIIKYRKKNIDALKNKIYLGGTNEL